MEYLGKYISAALVVIVFGICAVNCWERGVTDIALGYNVTYSDVASEGYSTVVLDGLELINSNVSGFHITMAEDDCTIRFEIWDKISNSNYRLWKYKEFRANKGYHEVELLEQEKFSVTANQKLGFSSLKASSTCVGYLYVRDKRRSQTMFYSFKTKPRPAVGQTYYFDPYQTTFLFPIGIIVKNPNITSTTTSTTTTTTTTRRPDATISPYTLGRFIGYNYTTDLMSNTGPAAIVHHGLKLEDGTVIGFRFRNAQLNCRIRLQIWRKVEVTEKYYNYTLIYEKIYTGERTGLIHLRLQPSDYFKIRASDSLGFTTENQNYSCVPYYYVQDVLRSQSIKKVYPNRNYARLFDTVSFPPFQTTMLFAIEVELLVLSQTGETGPRGFQGIAGEFGARGSRGDVGLRGEKGTQGDLGDRGENGDGGDKGPQGNTGPVGPAGPRGSDGTIGQEGARGNTGPIGDRGLIGDRGIVGDRGDYGEKGPPGETGITGLTGDAQRGTPGETGIVGPIGSTGLQGLSGEIGSDGGDGGPGPVGVDGVYGPKGPMWSPLTVDFCSKSGLKCEHHCLDTPLGAKCGCKPGYLVSEDTRCLEINECHIENGNCQYDCVNTPGSYHCDCPLGLRLSNDSHKCDDYDECSGGKTSCKVSQLCINLWNGYYCAGPFEKTSSTSTGGSASAQTGGDNVNLVTRAVVIGLLLWLIIITILTIMALILMIPECRECCAGKPNYPPPAASRRPQFYYPAFFPRVSLDRRPSADRMDILEARQSRSEQHLDRHDNDGIINEAHIHDANPRSEF
ncbi:uncharacterized protein LOC126818374 isoform X1 [Patella vulgata]|uniref:uncharacterized protein LOC126818374 isoform X1 n=1 Tax=Patella vulgata TaxID=6465 RepID=UPI00217F422A|nr:uncharacterized protein LOC126818374 isoform X1 [Patella vulgata]